ncbi:MAG: cytochrome c oxidase subunit II [Candidatus Eisenbacteria bacterium]
MIAFLASPFWMPPEGSAYAGHVDTIFDFVLWVSAFFFALIVVLMVLFMVRYRARDLGEAGPNIYHNVGLETVWTVIPIILVVFMFWLGFKGYMDLATPPANAYQVQVTGQKWKWLFTYPNGFVSDSLHVPVGRPVTLTMTSTDVIHALYIPAVRTKADVMPGRYSHIWFDAESAGTYPIYCAEYCGTNHSAMLTAAVVHPAGDFEPWLEKASNWIATMSPEAAGEKLYNQRGCVQCHSVDGSARVGPSFLGLWGKTRTFQDGSSRVADENYVRQSVLEPQSQIVKGFEGVMPTFQGRLRDPEINALIAYIRSLGENQGGQPAGEQTPDSQNPDGQTPDGGSPDSPAQGE